MKRVLQQAVASHRALLELLTQQLQQAALRARADPLQHRLYLILAAFAEIAQEVHRLHLPSAQAPALASVLAQATTFYWDVGPAIRY